jgi:hypothetical protein
MAADDAAGDPRWWQMHMLIEQDQYQSALAKLRELAASGHERARWSLAYTLVDDGHVEDGVAELRMLAQDHSFYTRDLVELLLEVGEVDEAISTQEEIADGFDYLMVLYGDHGRIDQLRAHVDSGTPGAQYHLVRALARLGRRDELDALANAGDAHARERLAAVLVDEGRIDEAIVVLREQVVDAALRPPANDAEDREGMFMVARADKDGQFRHQATWSIDELLAKQGRFDDLRKLVATGCSRIENLVSYMTEYGDTNEAEAIRRWGLNPDGSTNTPQERSPRS